MYTYISNYTRRQLKYAEVITKFIKSRLHGMLVNYIQATISLVHHCSGQLKVTC